MSLPSLKKCEEFASVLFILFSGLAITAFYKINNHMTFPNLDELLWHSRSRVFWDKMLAFDFSGLIQSAQPGVTVYWFTGFMMKLVDFDFNYVYYLIAKEEVAGRTFNDVMNNNSEVVFGIYNRISYFFNLPLMLITVIFFIMFYYLIKKIGFNAIVAAFSLLFLASNVFFVYWTTPSDKMLDIFMTLSFLTFLVYLKAGESRKYLVFSAIFGSLAVLSKISAFFIFPFYFFAYLFYKWPIDRRVLEKFAKDSLLWFVCFLVTSVVFLPTIVTHPVEIYNLILKTNGNVYETTYAALNYVQRIPDYLGTIFMVFGGSMSPGVVIFLAAFAVFASRKKYRKDFEIQPKKEIIVISAYIVLFMLEVIVLSLNHDIRFMSPSLVMINVIAGVAFYNTMEIYRGKINVSQAHFYPIAMIVLIIAQLSTIFTSGPVAQELLKRIMGKV